MEAPLRKLIFSISILLLAATMVVTVSYAWMTVSTNPIVEGIEVTIAGGNAISIAPDVSAVIDGVEYHYPGKFSSTLRFHDSEEYAYLKNVSALSPVSTADGLNWFIPEYYDITDEEIRNGTAVVGQIKPIGEFTADTELKYANLTAEKSDEYGRGGYVYLDFWVVSSVSDYYLRVSQGDDAGGSYLIELMEPEASGEGASVSYTLTATTGDAAASARIGFLVNEDGLTEEMLTGYRNSEYYSDNYTLLRGIYSQPGELMWDSPTSRFTVYEPNADLHTGELSGYYVTEPIADNNGRPELANISDRLTVQLTNTWREQSVEGISIGEIFTTAIFGKTFDDLRDVKMKFYNDYLQGQFMSYVNKGQFVKNTSALYGYAENGVVGNDVFSAIDKAGATDDVYIVLLEKNVPQRIRMFVWIEGQDIDCSNDLSELDFALSIELAGSTYSTNE